ncbi:hypothetical protein ACEUZ9_002867 [Paracoccus litorisediminis]|uniref:hypothetical protein n=1 Tax=Paracoccus litorisediminis TaxID=2006130 RepID=UPI00372E4356
MTHDLKPTTEAGIKRLAKRLKAESGMSHAEALVAAARQAGFENYRHFTNRDATPGNFFPAAAWKRRVPELIRFRALSGEHSNLGRARSDAAFADAAFARAPSSFETEWARYTSHHRLARILGLEGQIEEAIREGDFLLAINPRDNWGSRSDLAMHKLLADDITGVRKLVEIYPDDLSFGLIAARCFVYLTDGRATDLDDLLATLMTMRMSFLDGLTSAMMTHDAISDLVYPSGGNTEAILFFCQHHVAIAHIENQMAQIHARAAHVGAKRLRDW